MKRLVFALVQIGIVAWAGVVVFQHDLHNPGEISPFLAALILRGWLSKEINDPLFGHDTPWDKLKRLVPKRQPRAKWDV